MTYAYIAMCLCRRKDNTKKACLEWESPSPPPRKMQIYKIHVAISPKIGLGPPWQILLSIKLHPPEKKILNPRMKLRG